MAYLKEKDGVMYCVEVDGTEYPYEPVTPQAPIPEPEPVPEAEPEPAEPSSADLTLAITLDLYARLEEKGVI